MTDESETTPDDLRAGRGTIKGEIDVRQYWLGVAENYDDSARANTLRGEIAELEARGEKVTMLRAAISDWDSTLNHDGAGRPSKNADKALADVFEAIADLLDRP